MDIGFKHLYLTYFSWKYLFPFLKGSIHHSTMKERCPDTLRCDEICNHGFFLRTKTGQECPVCQCAVVTATLYVAYYKTIVAYFVSL